MTNQPGFSNRCPHCGYWLPPNHPGPCPSCGKALYSALVAATEEKQESSPIEIPILTASGRSQIFKLTYNETMGVREKIAEVVNASGTAAFNATHSSPPPNWSDIADIITGKLTNKLPEILPPILGPILEKHEREKESRDNSLSNQLRKIADDIQNPATWFWIIISTIVGSVIVYLVFGHP